ncbi:MAG TPA: glycosyltransferase family 2 protein [Flavitalea sp.]|nr:glycosyltransferase family 2 protein [Flavitalea sp.]
MTSPTPYISICIPAYKRVDFLRRLLLSIKEQTFTDFEVIITDDSPDESVSTLLNEMQLAFPYNYVKNMPSLGTPANWNKGLSIARGAWIKLMHDDDWFATPNALQRFADEAKTSTGGFIFSAFNNVKADYPPTPVFCSTFRLKLIQNNPVTLVAKNAIGPPSAVMHKNDSSYTYDVRMKWLVDMDFYMRFLSTHSVHYIPETLVNIGISDSQVTQTASLVPEVEIPEHMLLADKSGIYQLRSTIIYDAWWRLMRNLGIRSETDIRKAGYQKSIPKSVKKMIDFQSRIPKRLLKIGVISKLLMLVCYLFNRPPEESLSSRKPR